MANDIEFCEVVGLLPDLDFGIYLYEYCVKQVNVMEEFDLDETVIESIESHGCRIT